METPGLLLKGEREARGLTLTELAKVTRIPESTLEHIERNDFDALPAEVFVRGFLRNYARQLSISSDEIMASYEDWKLRQSPVDAQAALEETRDFPKISAPSEASTSANSDEEKPVHSMRFAYVAIVLIAAASVGLSLLFMGTGEAEEGDVDFMIHPDENIESPFLISNTSEGWVSE